MHKKTDSLLKLPPMGLANFGVRADFDVDARKLDADGNVVSTRSILKACPNLITDAGMDFIGTGYFNQLFNYLQVGSGNTAPANGDTALTTFVASVGRGGSGDNTWAWDTAVPTTLVYKAVFQFGVGVAAGLLKELGLSLNATSTTFTHALFKDAFGDPTIVDVDSDEQLIVTYRFYFVPNLSDAVLVTTQNGTEYTITTRVSNAGVAMGAWTAYNARVSGILDTYWGAPAVYYYFGPSSGVGPVNSGPLGDVSAESRDNTSVAGTYTPGNFYRDDTYTVPLSRAVGSDLGAILFIGFPYRVQIGISPRLNKTINDTIKITLRTSWSRL